MENLMKLVKAYLEETEKQNRFNSLILNNLEKTCSDINKVNEILNRKVELMETNISKEEIPTENKKY